MKKSPILGWTAAVLFTFALSTSATWSQIMAGNVVGTVTDNAEPVADLQVVLTSANSGRQYKSKTDKKGAFAFAGMMLDSYKLEVMNAKREVLYTMNGVSVSGSSPTDLHTLDLAHPEMSGGFAGSGPVAAKPLSKEEMKAALAKQQADNARIASMNGLIVQAQQALQAGNWADGEAALKQLLAANPDTKRWEFYQALGDTQGRSKHYQDAIATYEKGIQLAQGFVAGTSPSDPHVPSSDPAKAKAGVSQMLFSQGNDYFAAGDKDKAADVYSKSAAISTNPGVAYYNLCATQFNRGDMDAALAACEKSIAADPRQAGAYYLKGSILFKRGKTESGKYSAPAGTAEALNKYLELAPTGEHSGEVKTLLQTMGK